MFNKKKIELIKNSRYDEDLNNLDISGITYFSGLFKDTDFKKDIYLWNTSSVIDK